ncbi:hypothetical protein SAMD00019534_016350, partial [Acytostelium subglobosum LB1]|uniref:hypothetical protein n=1 Tax=Acytostelium subglobosum LB1 TaxID=1410327 RepID=UPI000644B5F3
YRYTMKRSLAPSSLYEKKQKTEHLPSLENLLDQQQQLMEAMTKKSRKKQAPMRPINHLELFNVTMGKTKLSSEDDDAAASTSAAGPISIADEDRKGKNVVMQLDSPPLYYLCNYKNIQKAGDDGMAILEVTYDAVVVISMEGKQIGRATLTRMGATDDDEGGGGKIQKVLIKKKEVYFQEDFTMTIGNKWVKILITVLEDEYKKGTIFLKTDMIVQTRKEEAKGEKKLKFRLSAAAKPKGFVVPLKGLEKVKRLTKPLHNPYSPNAVVLYQPKDQLGENNIPVVVDPILAAKLRPHQRIGVQFMFDCLAGFRGNFGNGCILADDMGLGKTIQAITILWTLLKQGIRGEPTSRKAVIVAPAGLVRNWCQELQKWLGDGIKPVAIGQSTKLGLAKLAELELGKSDVLVISYDQLRIWIHEIVKIDSIGLIICDEGHRMKNADAKSTQAVNMIPTKRRVILSGTPIQNNLTEFYAMVNFVNPGVLGSVSTFNNVYNAPILASRLPDATSEDKRLGRERSLALTRLTQQFILRRTAAVNTQYLPKKTEYTVFCELTPLQKTLYKHLIEAVKARQFGSFTGALPLITTLKKLSNCPELIYMADNDKEDPVDRELADSVMKQFPKEFNLNNFQPQFSGKLQFLDILLQQIKSRTKDRVVVISNYTQTLTVLAKMCKVRKYEFFQLDGSTPIQRRQELVNLFNNPANPQFIFLLSSKAGGIGLNLIGANHLVLFDPDWNPANDAQAMARVWREGQKKPVSIYRTLSTGTIEEKIYQRQITKMALSVSVVEGDSDNAPSFDQKDLKDIFNLREDTICDTHDMLGVCHCGARRPTERVQKFKRDTMCLTELADYKHYHDMSTIPDKMLSAACTGTTSFVFANDKPPVVKERKKITECGAEEEEIVLDGPPARSSQADSSSSKDELDTDDVDGNFTKDEHDYEADSDSLSSEDEDSD